jgi:glutamyl-tRNA reductase
MTLTLRLIGLNHKTAPVEVRERLAIPEWRLQEVARKLIESPGVGEGYVLSTCNRVEFLVAEAESGAARAFLCRHFELDAGELASHLYEYSGREAVQHLFRVAASLDSMIVGEPQILGQVKEAYAVARAAGAVGSELDPLLAHALNVARKVRRDTSIGSSAVSVASVAVELAQQIFGSLKGRAIYLVGAGKMSELAARHLIAHGAGAIFVANRTHDRAVSLAEKFSGQAIRFEQLYETADQADIVITSTGAPHAIFKREHAERFMQRRRNRPMFFIDIAVPRDVDSEMNRVDGIFVYDIDDLQQVVSGNLADRGKEADRAEQIIASEVDRFFARAQGHGAAPAIVALQQHMEAIRLAELERMRGKLGRLTPEQQAAVDALTRGIINKVLHPPITAMKSEAGFVESLLKVFGISAASSERTEPATEQPATPAAGYDSKEASKEAKTRV